MVGVRVRLQHADDPDSLRLRGVEVLLDRERRIDDDCFACFGVADEVRAAAEILVDELPENHVAAAYVMRVTRQKHVAILGAGFAGLELATRLTELLPGEVRVTLIDQSDSFSFGYSKLDVLFGRRSTEEIKLHYREIAREGIEFRQERITAIDPQSRHVTTDRGAYDADILAVALGASYDKEATPGFEESGFEYYTVAGAERLRDALPGFDSGRILIGILGQPFKCPPAPFEGALLLHDHFVNRGTREDVEIRVIGPMAAPVPVTKEISQAFVGALGERGIEYGAQQLVVELDPDKREARLAGGGSVPYDLFIGIPVHRVPDVVASSGLAVDGWVPVDRANLATRFPGVYAIGDVAAAGTAKAGAFAESAARVVAADIAAGIRGGEPPLPWDGTGGCYLEFGGGRVAKVDANFLGGPSPTGRLIGPSREIAAEKAGFGSARRERWFGSG
jgi:sulfide:quinone oxidoreductase